MIGTLFRAAALAGIYLFVLSSLAPGDVIVGSLLGLALAWGLHPSRIRRGAPGFFARVRATAVVLIQLVFQVSVGSWHVMRFCLGAPASPGIVEVPRDSRSRLSVAMWGVLTGESPDAVVVDFDRNRNVLLVHMVDARNPGQIRDQHRRSYERWQRKVVP